MECWDFRSYRSVKELTEGELQERIKKPVNNKSDESLVTGFFDSGQQQTSKRVGPCLGRHSSREGGAPAAGSPTASLLRLHPSHEPHRGDRPP